MKILEVARVVTPLIAWLFVIGALTLDLFFLFRFSRWDMRWELPRIRRLRKREITTPSVALALLIALLFTVPNQIGSAEATAVPRLSSLLSGSLLYMLAALLLILFAMAHASSGLSALFHAPGLSIASSAWKGAIYGAAAVPPIMLVNVLTNELIVRAGYETQSQPVIEWFLSPDTTSFTRIAIFFTAVIVAPLAEELIFRGILFPAVLKRNSWIFAALLSGCIFSLIHFHPSSFLSIFMLSVFFCAGYSATGSLITPIVMHMVFNAVATFFAFCTVLNVFPRG